MAELNINLGVEEYVINGKTKIYLNPTDPAFVGKMYARFTELEAQDKEWRGKMASLENAAVLQAWEEGDAIFRGAVDDLLGDGTCASICGSISVLALSDGLPLWMNIMLAIIDMMDSAVAREQKATNPKLQKYLSKYHK